MKIIRTSTIGLSLNVLLKGQLKFLTQYYDVVGIASEGVDLEEVEEREKIRTIPVNMKRGISPLNDLVSLIKLYIVLKKEKPDIVHSITPKAGLLSMLAAKFAGVPIRIHTFTGLIFPYKKGVLQKILICMDRLLCWASTQVYPEGLGVKNDLIKYNITTKELKVLGYGNVNGVPLDYFSKDQISDQELNDLRKKLKISLEDFVFIYVGRLVGDKGINELISAFRKCNIPKAKLLLVGPIETEDPLQQDTMHHINHNKDILSVGFQKDVRPYFALANVLVFPSYREGFPNVVLQAGAMELPAIVTDISGSNEIITNGENGLVVPPKDAEALRKAMQKVYDDKNLVNHLKTKARRTIEERFEQKYVWEAIHNEYECLIKKMYSEKR